MEEKPKLLCVVCNTRVARHLGRRACRKCALRTKAEGTRRLFGLSERPDQKQRVTSFVRLYNKMIRDGKRLRDVAEAMGWEIQTVKNELRLLRKMGVHLEVSRNKTKRKPVSGPIDRSTLKAGSNEHGGGKWGITGCNCEPCQDRRSAQRKIWNAANRDRLRGYQRDYQAKKKAQREPS